MSGIELTFLSLLGAAIAGALVRVVMLHVRIARRARELESELQRRRTVEAELEGAYQDLHHRLVERTQALEAHNEELTRLRFALETANRRLKHLVRVDALTGIANRRHFDRALAPEMRRPRRDGHPLSLVFLDLDDLELLNDT